MAYDLTKKDSNGIPCLKKFIDNFTDKNFQKAYTIDDGKTSSHRYRSWEYCREAFLKAKGKTLDAKAIDNLALHLAFYLASWGMYRGSSFLLSLDYTVHKQIVEIAMQEKYRKLFDSDLLIRSKEGRQEYLNLLFGEGNDASEGIVTEMRKSCYNKWHEKVTENPIVNIAENDNNGKEEEKTKTDTKILVKDVSSILITKVLMGIFGCIPAYDTYVLNGLTTQNITARFDRDGVIDLLKNVVLCEEIYSNISSVRETMIANKQQHTEFDLQNYTYMKFVDMLFWEIGAGEIVEIKRNNSTITSLKALSDEDKEKIKNQAETIIQGNYNILDRYTMEVGGKTFRSNDLGALLMCVYQEFKIPEKELKKKKVKDAIQGTRKGKKRDGLEWKWLATTRFSSKLIK